MQILKTPVYDFKGQVVGTQGMFWDVTARTMAEQAMVAAQGRGRVGQPGQERIPRQHEP